MSNAAPLPAVWPELAEGDGGDAVVAALAAAGVEFVFFTSGSEICFYQESIAKARACGRPSPRLITMTHEHASLNAALGYAAVSGRPAVTAAHVDAGTLHHGGAIHNAMHAGLPVLMTAGFPPTTYAGSSAAARNAGGHLWLQETFDQHSVVRQYVKWDRRLQAHDNPALVVSRALQVAMSEPCGPVYLSIPPEVAMQGHDVTRFPTAAQLGVSRPGAPDPEGAREIARRLLTARNPRIVVGGSGRNPAAVPALVSLCSLLGIGVVHAATRRYLSFPFDHPLMMGEGDLADADVVLVLDSDVPWVPGRSAPPDTAWTAVVALDPVLGKLPTYEFGADLRLAADPLLALRAIESEAATLLSGDDRARIAARAADIGRRTAARREAIVQEAKSAAGRTPIDPLWLSYQVATLVHEDAIVIDDSLPHNRLYEFLGCRRPGSWFYTPGTSGGWAPGAAFGAKLAAPERDVIAVTGDGFYMFGTANAALWAATHYKAPYLTVIYQNRSYGTGTRRLAQQYPGGYAQRSGFDGGYFDPPIDFAREAEAAGAYGENVRDPAQLADALRRGLEHTRSGRPAVIAVWLARHLQDD
ncbi:MAG: thiamine pyrophosphate-requiring protein [Burkholderiales bacterium]